MISLETTSPREYRRMAYLFITKGSMVLITTSMHLTTPGMGERNTNTDRGQSSP